jgi:hypothetical protein
MAGTYTGLNWATRTAVGPEAEFAVAPETLTPLAVKQNTVRGPRELVPQTYDTGVAAAPPPLLGKWDVQGGLEVPLANDSTLALLLSLIFGTPTAGVYARPNDPSVRVPSFTLARDHRLSEGGLYRYLGCMAAKLDFNFVIGGDLALMLAIIGSVNDRANAAAIASAAAFPLGILKGEQSASGVWLAGTKLAHGTEFSLAVDFGVDAETYTVGGGGQRTQGLQGQVAPSGKLKTLLRDNALIDAAYAQTPMALSIRLCPPGSSTPLLTFDVATVTFKPTDPERPAQTGRGGQLLDLEWTGFSASPSADPVIKATLSLSTPTASPGASSITTTTPITLTCGVPGAAIYYTTDGTAPTSGSTLASGPITLSSGSVTLKAIAILTGFAPSPVLSVAYTVT